MRAKVDRSILQFESRKNTFTVTGGRGLISGSLNNITEEGDNGSTAVWKTLTNIYSPLGATFDCGGTGQSIIQGGSILMGVAGRVITDITGATTMNVGDAALATRFATGIGVAANTIFNPALASAGGLPLLYTANGVVRLTAIGGAANFSGGTIRIVTSYFQVIQSTS